MGNITGKKKKKQKTRELEGIGIVLIPNSTRGLFVNNVWVQKSEKKSHIKVELDKKLGDQ